MAIKINSIKLSDFKVREGIGEFEVLFEKNGKLEVLKKSYLLKHPNELFNDLWLNIKSKGKVLIDDPSLTPVELLKYYSPVNILNEEKTEERIINFIRELCMKYKELKLNKDAKIHMKLLEGFRNKIIKFE